MYNSKTIASCICLFLVLESTFSQAQEANFDLLTKIIQTGNAKDLARQLSSNVELNINGSEATYSKAQAEAILKDFFSKNAPLAFTLNHKGASKGGLPYAIGEYNSSTGDFRVWIRLKTFENKSLVYEMSFIKE
jgi:uncharacterized protein DUF4783